MIKGVSKTTEHGAKEQKGGFLSKSLDSLGVKLSGNILVVEETIRTGAEF